MFIGEKERTLLFTQTCQVRADQQCLLQHDILNLIGSTEEKLQAVTQGYLHLYRDTPSL